MSTTLPGAETSATDLSTAALLTLAALTGVGLACATAAGVWKLSRVRGPERLPAPFPAVPWLGVILMAALAWIVVQSAYFASKPTVTPATSPAEADRPPLQPADLAFLSTVPAGVATLVLLAGAAAVWPGLLRRVGLGPSQMMPAVPIAVFASLIAYPLMMWVMLALQWVYTKVQYEHPTRHQLLEGLAGPIDTLHRAAIIAGAVVVAPLFEELLFRGGLQTLFRRALGGIRISDDPGKTASPAATWLAILLASAAFAMIHEPWMAPAIFVLSVCIGYAYERTGNLWVAIWMHVIFNGVNVIASGFAP